jgi:glycosyltransferase involved in cell wall biosynthesis
MEAPRRPTVAVVIPCYGHGRFLATAIESALKQSLQPAEVVIVDDGSDEDLAAIVSGYPSVSLIRKENGGLAAARNTGLRASRSDRIVFLDADDWLLPDAVDAGLRCFASHPDAAFVYGGFEEFGPDTATARFTEMGDRLDLMRCNWVAMIGSVMFDRTKLLQAGGFDETLGMCEDWDAYLRLSRGHAFASHSQTIAVYRKHDANMSSDVGRLRYWIDEVRERERQRGLTKPELLAWREGEHVIDVYYGPKQKRSLKQRVQRKIRSVLIGL